MAGSADLREDTTLFTELYQVRAAVLIQKLQKTGKITDHCKKLKVMTSVTNNADKTGLFFSQQPSKTLNFREHFCHSGIKSEQWVTVLITCNEDSILVPVSEHGYFIAS
jgi:hypothetical protein